jgi:hypothetical protein
MSEKFISPRKRMAMGDKPHKYADGGFVTPRKETPTADVQNTPVKTVPRVGGGTKKPSVPEYADNVVGDERKPQLVSRAGVRHGGKEIEKEAVATLAKGTKNKTDRQ